MATKVKILNPEYLNELKNGAAFSLNPADVSTHLLGHVGDSQRVKLTVQLSNSYTLGAYNITGGDTITLSNGASFLSQDFYTGGTAYLSHINGNNWQFDIANISTDGTELTATNIIEYDNAGAPTGPVILPDGPYGTGTDRDILRSLVTSNGLVTKFGFVPNTGNVSFVSPLDNVIQAYKFDGLQPGGAPGPVITGSWDSAVQGSNTGSMTCQFINVVADNGINKTAGTSVAVINSIQEFEIIQDFIIPEYEQGDFNNVQNQIAPDRLIDSLKQVFEFEFRQSLSDPNQSQFGEYNTVLGNVKYFNENYVDIDNQYSVSDVVLTDTATGLTITEINASSTTRITCSVNSALGTFLTTDPVLLEHTYLPNGDQYGARSEVYRDVWLYETLRQQIDAVATSDTIITLFTATLISANQIDLQFDITFTVPQQTQIQEGYNYALSIKIADSSLTTVLSDVSKQIITADQYSLNTDISGLANFPQSYLYTRPMMYPIVTPGDRFTDVKAWIQDGLLYDWTLNLDLVEEATLEALTVRLVAFNTNDNTWFEFDRYNYDLGAQVVTAGPPSVQNLLIDKTRGYDLADGDKLNYAKLQTGTYSAPNQPYTGQTGFRATWQDWISLPTADTVFYNPAEPNNNLNFKSSNYSLLNGYVIALLIDARIGKLVDGVNVITQYVDRSANLEIFDFEEQDGSPVTWTGVAQTFDLGGADLGGQILDNQNTVVKGSFTPDIPVSDPSLYWGEVRIEALNNPSNNYYVLSTLQAGSDNNPLIAPTGSTYAKIDIISSLVEVCAVVDYELLPAGADWSVSVRFGLIDQTIPVVPVVQVQIDGDTRQSDGDWLTFQQTEIMAAATLVDSMFSLTEAAVAGTPPGWLFKVSPTSAEPSGDAYVKANWGAIGYIDFDALALILGANSDLWVYAEAADSTKINEGLLIEFTRPQVGQNPSTIIANFPANAIDRVTTLYFDREIIITDIVGAGNINSVYMGVFEDTAAVEDWPNLLVKNNGVTVADLNSQISIIGDGVKYAVRAGCIEENGSTSTITFTFDYNSAVDAEKSMSIQQNDINPKNRVFGNCMYFGPFPNTDNIYCETLAGDVALQNLLDLLGGNPWTIEAWFVSQFDNVIDGNQRTNIFGNRLVGQAGGAGPSILWRTQNKTIQVAFSDNTNGSEKAIRWDLAQTAPEGIIHCVVTSNGSGELTTGNLDIVINGIRMPDIEGSVAPDLPLTSGVPTSGTYHVGLFQGQVDGRANPDRVNSIRIYDKVLSYEEIQESFNDPTKTHSGLFRDWDFANHTGTTVPELVTGTQIMNVNTLGSAPTNPAFDS